MPARRRPPRGARLSRPLAAAVVVALALAAGGCAGRYSRPRTLATLGAALIVSGSATWVAGENGQQRTMTDVGFTVVAAGIVAAVAAGGWMASIVACSADADCAEAEQCREIPAPPGGIPYKQCVSR